MNYLPVVRLDDWFERDGFDIIKSRLLSDAEASILGVMKECALPESLLNSQTYRSIFESFFANTLDKKFKTKSDRFLSLLERLELISLISEDKSRCSELYSINEKLSSNLLKELIHQKLSGLYFLSSIEFDGDSTGYVILLREVQSIPRTLAQLIASGLDRDEASSMPYHRMISFDHAPFAMPIGELKSPAVEHVLQTFSTLFGRIGLDDPPKSYVEEMCTRRPRARG
ncbi:hypothetical protein [Bosea sp. UNC402CLCol]|uniref:hypothetical protein n=1 Tax=Bosea sp. UNC402CLCol TaxID=1510531 RepID=UPI0012E02812|nr:hypothetical protein [Bosea sp. UNC402CLCol]